MLLAFSLLAFFIFELQCSLNPVNYIEATFANNNNVVVNNQISARDVNNLTSTLTSEVTFPSANQEVIKEPGTIATVTIAGIAGVLIFSAGVIVLLITYNIIPCSTPQNVETIGLETFYSQ